MSRAAGTRQGNFELSTRRTAYPIMKAKETIAIIGATGKMGSSIAKDLSKDIYRLILMSKDVTKLSVLKDNLSTPDTKALIDIHDCAREGSWEADVIIMATPYEEEREIAEKIRDVATGKIVISVSGRPYAWVTTPNSSRAEELQELLPYSKIVKVFNTSFCSGFHAPAVAGGKPDAFIAANNGQALEAVSRIVTSAGMNPVVVGDLSVSGALERIQCRTLDLNQVPS